jgi:hypothetical protein
MAKQTNITDSSYGKADFKIKSLDVVPSEVVTGESATATVIVMNSGNIEGTYAVELRINGIVLDTKDVTVAPGSTKLATFTINRDTAGTYEISIEDTLATLVVKQGTTIMQTTTTANLTTTITSQVPTTQNITTTPTTPRAPNGAEAVVVVSFDPNPVTIILGQVYWKIILTETKGVGVTMKSMVAQYYSNSGSLGSSPVFSGPNWGQGFSGAYLPPNKQGTIGAGHGFIDSFMPTYVIYTIIGTDDNGHELIITARVDFKQ